MQIESFAETINIYNYIYSNYNKIALLSIDVILYYCIFIILSLFYVYAICIYIFIQCCSHNGFN